MPFGLFIVLNGILLLRPEEVFEPLAGLHLYMVVIGLCIATTFPQLIIQLAPQSLARRPISACVIALLPAIVLSKVAHGEFGVVDEFVPVFARILVYFFLFMSVVNTPKRMVTFMGWIGIFVIGLCTIGLLQFHQIVDIKSLKQILQNEYDPVTGQVTATYPRLNASGIYHDPNDLCLILVTAIVCCACNAAFSVSPILRFLWLCPIGLFAYAMVMTGSRGGVLGLMTAFTAYLYARYGLKRCLPLLLLALPVVLAVFGGRATEMSASSGTAQSRLQLWSEGLTLMTSGPINLIFGIGAGEYQNEMGLVAHNSFIHAYVELGLIGGTLFLSAFFLSGWGMWYSKAKGDLNGRPALLKLYPFVFAILIGYSAGTFSLSRNYVVPTYMILGFASAFIAMIHPRTPPWFCLGQRLFLRLVLASLVGFVFLKLFTQTFVQPGSS